MSCSVEIGSPSTPSTEMAPRIRPLVVIHLSGRWHWVYNTIDSDPIDILQIYGHAIGIIHPFETPY